MKKEKRNYWWLAVIILTLIIYLTLPLGPEIIKFLSDTINNLFNIDYGYYIIGHCAAVIIGFIFLFLIYNIIKKRKQLLKFYNYLILLIILGIYTYFLLTMKVPTEKIHFIEYGLLSWFIYRALKKNINDISIFFITLFIGYPISLLDEFIQYLIPSRSGELVDAIWNFYSVALIQLFIVFVWKPQNIKLKIENKNFRLLIILIFISLISTSLFINITSEFGIKIIDKEIGIFYSRLNSKEEIIKTDEQKYSEYANILNAETEDNYDTFISKTYHQKEYPFLNEMRVHIFRRDRYAAQFFHYLLRTKANDKETLTKVFNELIQDQFVAKIFREHWFYHYLKNVIKEKYNYQITNEIIEVYLNEQIKKINEKKGNEKDLLKEYLYTAYRENQILEKYFKKTLENSKYYWDKELTKKWFDLLSDDILKIQYKSAVAERIITAFTLKQMWIFTAIFSFILILLFFYSFKNK